MDGEAKKKYEVVDKVRMQPHQSSTHAHTINTCARHRSLVHLLRCLRCTNALLVCRVALRRPQAIEDHLKVLDWEKTEMQQVAERVAAIKAREMKVVEKRLSLEQAQLDAESQPQGMPEELRKFM